MICGLFRPSTGKVQVRAEGRLIDYVHDRGRLMGCLSP
ncbi:MAG: hypothetical protein ACQES4_08980 [Bacillota bacterium]